MIDKGPTKSKSKVYQKFGVYRTGITRYLNYVNIDMMKNFEKNNTLVFFKKKKNILATKHQ